MSFAIACPNCRHTFPAPEPTPDRAVNCPNCQRPVPVMPPATPARRYRTLWYAAGGVLILVLLVVAVKRVAYYLDRAEWDQATAEWNTLRHELETRERELEEQDPAIKALDSDGRLLAFGRDERWRALSERLNQVDHDLGRLRDEHPDWAGR